MDPEVRKEFDALRDEMQAGFASLRTMIHARGAAGSSQRWPTVALWVLLVLLFFSFYSVFSRQRPHSEGERAPAQEPPR